MEPRKTGIRRERRDRRRVEYKIDKIIRIPATAPIVRSVSPTIIDATGKKCTPLGSNILLEKEKYPSRVRSIILIFRRRTRQNQGQKSQPQWPILPYPSSPFIFPLDPWSRGFCAACFR